MAMIKKIPVSIAILICINSMIGAGLFINPQPLSQIAGPLGFMGYVFSALLFLPIILSIATLAQLHPVSGGFYAYVTSYLGRAWGFCAIWFYFIGKTIAISLLLFKALEFFQGYSPFLAQYPTLTLEYVMIAFFVTINIAGVFIGGKIQYLFTILKAIPILFAFFVGIKSFNPSYYMFTQTHIANSVWTISIAAFALMGFEVICAVGHLIQDSAKNIKRVIISAFLIVASINIIFQIISYASLGTTLTTTKYSVLAMGLSCLPGYPSIAHIINGAAYAAVFGGFYSLMTSNCWNLHAMAKNNHIPFSKTLAKISRTNVPWVSLIVEGLLCAFVITITSEQTILQNMSIFPQAFALFLNMIAAYKATKIVSNITLKTWIPLTGFASCTILILISFIRIIQAGISFSILALFLSGIIAAWIKGTKGPNPSYNPKS